MQNNQNQKPLTTYQNNPKEVFVEQAFIHFYRKVKGSKDGYQEKARGERAI